MDPELRALTSEERTLLKLRALYRKYGYTQYRMSKFEEYDLYAGNKDFLVSENVLTFTDLNGKLMALKPDVTLSIVRGSPDRTDSVRKVFYNENVYRTAGSTRTFREIPQTGMECIGPIDDYRILEVLLLAAESLACVSDRCVLEISQLDILAALTEGLGVTEETRRKLTNGTPSVRTLELAFTVRMATFTRTTSWFSTTVAIVITLKLAAPASGRRRATLISA